MIKVLIIDDEFVIRMGIKTSIEWESLGMTIVGEASNGREGLEKALSLEPHIVIADVRMPVMDGLEFSRVLKQKMPNVKIVILSGYDDFQYARTALQLGVNEYLLKPVGAGELINIMIKQRDYILKEMDENDQDKRLKSLIRENLPFMQVRFLNSFVKGEITNIADIERKCCELDIDLSGKEYQAVIIDIDDFSLITENMSNKEKEKLKMAIKVMAEEILSPLTKSLVCYGEFDYLYSILNVNDPISLNLEELCNKIRYAVRGKMKLTVTIGVSNSCTYLTDIPEAYNEALLAVRKKAFAGKDRIIRINDVLKTEYDSQDIHPTEYEEEIIACLKAMQGDKLDTIFEKIYFDFLHTKAEYEEIKNISLRFIMVALRQLEKIGVDFEKSYNRGFNPHYEIEKYETVEDIIIWMREIFKAFIKAIRESKNEKYKGIVKVALQYISEHYNEDIGVEDIAAITYVSPNYFSRVFKEETGKSFTEWLNMVRIDKAKILLKDLRFRIYEIAEKVGYNDYKILTQNFKKYTGFTPKKFRDKNAT